MTRSVSWLILAIAVAIGGCSQPADAPPPGAPPAYAPIDPDSVVLWDRQTQEFATLIEGMAAGFNAGHDGPPVRIEYMGDYGEIFRKVSLSIQAGEVPGMAVGYQGMTVEYARTGAVQPLDGYIADPEIGLSEAELADFHPAVLETNRYEQFDEGYYSFPFCKSVLVLYFNKAVIAEAGFEAPPATWDAFLEQARDLRAKAGKFAYAADVDCSTLNGMIFSRGGGIVADGRTLYDAPESIAAFEFLETLVKEDLAYQITPGTYDDREAFAQGKAAFFFRSNVHQPFTQKLMGGSKAGWGMAMIPQADPADPRTVLYGPNVMIFRTTPEQARTAWEFVKYFTEPDRSAKWALATGYIPMHKSAADNPAVQAHWDRWEYNRVPFDCLAVAQPEPNLAGWQEVRTLVERAWTDVMAEVKTGREAALELKRKADAVLARYADL